MTRSTIPRSLAALAAALTMAALPLAAAQDDANGADGQQDQEVRAALRFAHLAPEGPNLEIVVDGETVVEDLAPNTVSDYVFLEPGDRQVQVFTSGLAPATTGDGAGIDPVAGADDAAAPALPPEERQDSMGAQDPAQEGGPPPAGIEGDPATPAPAGQPGAADPAVQQEGPILERSVELQESAYATLLLSTTGQQQEGRQQEDQQQEAQDGQEGDGQEGDAQEGDAQEGADEPASEDAPEGGAVSEDPESEDPPTDEQAGQAPGEAADAGGAQGTAGQPGIALEAHLIEDGVEALPGAGEASVRVVNGAPRAGSVDVVAAHRPEGEDAGQEGRTDGEGDGPQRVDGQELATGLAGDDASEYVTVPAGRHHLQVLTEGGDVAVDLEDMLFEAGLVYTIYVGATEDAEDLVITATVDAGVSAEER